MVKQNGKRKDQVPVEGTGPFSITGKFIFAAAWDGLFFHSACVTMKK